jgi:hypothetical protein
MKFLNKDALLEKKENLVSFSIYPALTAFDFWGKSVKTD